MWVKMASCSELDRMSAEELGQLISDKGFAEEVREAFSGKRAHGLIDRHVIL